jgi:exodeoxyribonuclease VII large subunit
MTSPLEILTVAQLNRQAKQLLESHFAPIWVEGEISNFKHHHSGHMYFVLKDEQAELAAVMFASSNKALNFSPANGQRILARGNLTLYETRGQYQIVVQNLYPAGAGELWLAYEELKAKLQVEGLFDPARKKPLPVFPKRIGIITSASGAAVRDIIQVMGRRAPHATLVVRPTVVQGESAAGDIIAAIQEFTAYGQVDLVILSRGGGSLEDLWPFNDEGVARAVANCPLPTVSAVGHETDMTICDMVADVRAPTPSAVAELVIGDRDTYVQYLDDRIAILEKLLLRYLEDAQQQLRHIQQRYAFRQPLVLIEREKERVGQLLIQLNKGILHILERKAQILAVNNTGLSALDPHAVIERGYSIVTDPTTGRVVSSLAQLALGRALMIRLKDGSVGVEVTQLENT